MSLSVLVYACYFYSVLLFLFLQKVKRIGANWLPRQTTVLCFYTMRLVSPRFLLHIIFFEALSIPKQFLLGVI